jgi:hypothetical protein
MLEYPAFPHIIEAIVTFSPPAALVVWRATCTTLRDLADPLLFDRIVVSPHVGFVELLTPGGFRLPVPPLVLSTEALDAVLARGRVIELADGGGGVLSKDVGGAQVAATVVWILGAFSATEISAT